MYITFKHVDEDYYGISEYILPVVEKAIENVVFFDIVCEVLNTYNKYTEDIVNRVNKAMKLAEYKVISNNLDINLYKELEKSIENFYWNIIDEDFAKQLKVFDEDLYYKKKLAYPDKRISRYRGLMFEQMVIELVGKRFENYLFSTGCQVYINRCSVIAQYGEGNSYHKETIDVAGWEDKSQYGEFYECKISPLRFNEEHFRYLLLLKKQLDSNGISKSKVGFVSADTKVHIETRCDYLKETYGILDNDILLIGREDVYAIRNYSMPEIA